MNTFRAPCSETGRPLAPALVADDDSGVRDYVEAVPEQQDYVVLSFANPVEALEALIDRDGEISVLISDVDMPQMNGITFAREATRRFSDLPVLLITGRPETEGFHPPIS